jgi:hypothetical protein
MTVFSASAIADRRVGGRASELIVWLLWHDVSIGLLPRTSHAESYSGIPSSKRRGRPLNQIGGRSLWVDELNPVTTQRAERVAPLHLSSAPLLELLTVPVCSGGVI